MAFGEKGKSECGFHPLMMQFHDSNHPQVSIRAGIKLLVP